MTPKFLNSKEVQTSKSEFRPSVFKVLDSFTLNIPAGAVCEGCGIKTFRRLSLPF